MKLLLFATGLNINLDVVEHIEVLGRVISFQTPSSVKTFTANNPNVVMAEINIFLSKQSQTSAVITDYGTAPVITAITPTPVNLPLNATAGQGDTVTLLGHNLTNVIEIHFEDYSGGLDNDGVVFTPSLVTAEKVIGSFYAWGNNLNNAVSPVTFVYAYTSDALFTNTLPVSLNVN